MAKEYCRAKNPSTCKYHAKGKYKTLQESIDMREKELPNAKKYEDVVAIKDYIQMIKDKQDATVEGYALLLKEFKKAGRRNDFEAQAALAGRINKATKLRTEDDGYRTPWQLASENHTTFVNKVVDEGKHKDVVGIPYYKAGSGDIGTLGKSLINQGYKVVDFELLPMRKVTSSSPEEQAKYAKEAKERAEAYLKLENDDGYHLHNRLNGIFDDNSHTWAELFSARGLTYEDANGRRVKVSQDLNIDKDRLEW